jgi:hypothetical protein
MYIFVAFDVLVERKLSCLRLASSRQDIVISCQSLFDAGDPSFLRRWLVLLMLKILISKWGSNMSLPLPSLFFLRFSHLIPGFFDRREFILAQHPLDSTCATFWQMVWEQSVHLIVMLSSIDGQECCAFWPAESGQSVFFEVGYQKMKVTMLDEVDTATWKAFRLSLEVRKSEAERKKWDQSKQTTDRID